MSFFRAIFDAGRSQVLGLSAQLIAAMPVITMSIYLSHSVGLGAVADFALLIGVSSVAFTLALQGLRTRLVLDQFETFEDVEYLVLRTVATIAMALGILIAGLVFDAPIALIFAIVLLRVGDAALDLVLGIDQVRNDPEEQLYGYLKGSSVKLGLVVLCFAAAEFSANISAFVGFGVACLLHAIYAWTLFVKRLSIGDRGPLLIMPEKLIQLAKGAFVFCAAQFVCAVLISAPRFALPGISDREVAGAAAAALSISTFVGMCYFAVWLRWVSRFGKYGLRGRSAALFLLELAIVFVLLELALWLLAIPAMSMVYALKVPSHQETALWTLMASGAFFLIMTVSNIFKSTRLPWAESATYVGGLLALVAGGLLGANPSIPILLTAGAVGMAFVQAVFFILLTFRSGLDPA